MSNRHITIVLAALFILFACDRTTFEQKTALIQNEIQLIMKQQQESWNSGSIEGFMQYYWKSNEFTFQSGDVRLNGWDELFKMYRKNYSGENMGTLDFTDIEIQVLAGDVAVVLGRWRVTKKDSFKQGLFTLIFKKFNDGWRIIVDHSS
ncbi:MAG: nuclear transport factor 2 family protein [bacterium]|nr:nuclear transport factor 2 family protein [bacterium]